MLINSDHYFQALEGIKSQIRTAQYKAVLGLNREMIILYWNIGKIIIENSKYGNGFIENLARDIKSEFPNTKGYSVRNLRYMRRFAEFFDDMANLQVPLADLTWYHLQTLMDKVSDKSVYLWYAQKTLENGWSRNIMLHQIERKLFERQSLPEKTTNFEKTLPSPQSELARDTLKIRMFLTSSKCVIVLLSVKSKTNLWQILPKLCSNSVRDLRLSATSTTLQWGMRTITSTFCSITQISAVMW